MLQLMGAGSGGKGRGKAGRCNLAKSPFKGICASTSNTFPHTLHITS